LQYFEYAARMLKERNTPLQTSEETKRHFANAGFVDIKVIEKPIDIGDWRRGISIISYDVFNQIDPKTAAAGRAAVAAFGNAVPLVVENMRDLIPDDDERKAFGERAVEEYKSGRYRFSFRTYRS
jgi:hypothetical protein